MDGARSGIRSPFKRTCHSTQARSTRAASHGSVGVGRLAWGWQLAEPRTSVPAARRCAARAWHGLGSTATWRLCCRGVRPANVPAPPPRLRRRTRSLCSLTLQSAFAVCRKLACRPPQVAGVLTPLPRRHGATPCRQQQPRGGHALALQRRECPGPGRDVSGGGGVVREGWEVAPDACLAEGVHGTRVSCPGRASCRRIRRSPRPPRCRPALPLDALAPEQVHVRARGANGHRLLCVAAPRQSHRCRGTSHSQQKCRPGFVQRRRPP